jgi:hypothetical protein
MTPIPSFAILKDENGDPYALFEVCRMTDEETDVLKTLETSANLNMPAVVCSRICNTFDDRYPHLLMYIFKSGKGFIPDIIYGKTAAVFYDTHATSLE